MAAMQHALDIKDIRITHDGTQIVHGVALSVPAGTVHVLMGPNGSGKSSLANALMGHPSYAVAGAVTLDGEDLVSLSPDARAKKGLFLSMQHPPAIPGLSVSGFLRSAKTALTGVETDLMAFQKELRDALARVGLDASFSRRNLNEGFSGGERKRMEALQLLLFRPKYAVLDETDSGLDVDALKVLSSVIEEVRAGGSGILLITHNVAVLDHLAPSAVSVMLQGRIVATGGAELAARVAKEGFTGFTV